MRNSKTPIKLGLLSLALVLALPTNIKASEAKDSTMGKITAISGSEEAAQSTGNTSESTENNSSKDKPSLMEALIKQSEIIRSTINANEVQTSPKENMPSVSKPEPAPTPSQAPAPAQVQAPSPAQAPASETNVKNTNYLSQAYIKPSVVKDKLKEVKNDDQTKFYTLSFRLALEENGHDEEYQVYFFALKNSQVKDLSLVNTVLDEKASLADDNKVEEFENDEIKGIKVDLKFDRNAQVTGQIKINEEDEPGDYTVYYLVVKDGKRQIGKLETYLTKTADKTFAETDNDENLSLINPFDHLPFSQYIENDNIGDRKLTGYFNFSYAEYSKYTFTLTYIDPVTKEISKEEYDKPEDIIVKGQSLARIDIREKGALVASDEVKKDTANKATDKSASSGPQSLGDLMAGKVARTADQSASKEDIVKNLQTATKTLEGMVATNGKSVVEADQNLSQQEADQLADQLNKQDEIIRGLIEQALLNYELDKLAELEKDDKARAQEEYKKIKALVEDAKNASSKAENKLVELGEYTPDKKDSFNLEGNDLISITKGKKTHARLNITKLPSMTEIKDLTSHYDNKEVKDFSKNLDKKVKDAVKKVDTVTIGKETATKDKKEEKGGSESKGEIKNSYPIFARFLENLNKKSKTK
ncbi:hypothetical protein [uncultured Anaerococcus sp.]|uniref:hypothetical protein n=1 Tax=uncultured Anaerococcus sp. TaxID=293428 RepID=UPI0025F3CC9C|nr:hypothetical protein [uncultured Anaerococcus sp.]